MSPDLTSLMPIALQAITDVDLTVERMVREFLAEATPGIGFLGEEQGGADAQTRWVLDPIDGTANFTRGLPLNGISLALVHDHHAVLGVVALPFLNQRYWAAEGLGACRNHQSITAARTATLAEAIVDGAPHTTNSQFTLAAAPALRDPILAAVQAAIRTDSTLARSSGTAPGRQTPHGAPC